MRRSPAAAGPGGAGQRFAPMMNSQPEHLMLIFWCRFSVARDGQAPVPKSIMSSWLSAAAVGGEGQMSCGAAELRGLGEPGRDIPAQSPARRNLMGYAELCWTHSTAYSINSTGINLPFKKTWAISSKVKWSRNCPGKEVGKPLADNSYSSRHRLELECFWLKGYICSQIPILPNCAVLLCLFAVILGYVSKICAVSIFIWVSTPVALPPLYSFAVKPAVEKHSWFSSLTSVCCIHRQSQNWRLFRLLVVDWKQKSCHFFLRKYEFIIV